MMSCNYPCSLVATASQPGLAVEGFGLGLVRARRRPAGQLANSTPPLLPNLTCCPPPLHP